MKELKEDGDEVSEEPDKVTNDDMSQGTVPSIIDRRQKHQFVANETEQHLRKLENIT